MLNLLKKAGIAIPIVLLVLQGQAKAGSATPAAAACLLAAGLLAGWLISRLVLGVIKGTFLIKAGLVLVIASAGYGVFSGRGGFWGEARVGQISEISGSTSGGPQRGKK